MRSKERRPTHQPESTTTRDSLPRRAWQEPKLQFVKPTLVKQGEMKQITAGFIGTFVPDA